MSELNRWVHEYIRASEQLLKAEGLTDKEKQLIEEALNRISRELLDGGIPLDGHNVDTK